MLYSKLIGKLNEWRISYIKFTARSIDKEFEFELSRALTEITISASVLSTERFHISTDDLWHARGLERILMVTIYNIKEDVLSNMMKHFLVLILRCIPAFQGREFIHSHLKKRDDIVPSSDVITKASGQFSHLVKRCQTIYKEGVIMTDIDKQLGSSNFVSTHIDDIALRDRYHLIFAWIKAQYSEMLEREYITGHIWTILSDVLEDVLQYLHSGK